MINHERGAEVLRGLPGELVARVERSHGADWLPLEDDVLFARVTSRVLGAAEAAAFARAQLTEAFDGPVLSRMVRMGKALFGDEPGAWVRWIPHGWSLLFRGCGRWRVEVGCGGAVLHLTGLPPACARDAGLGDRGRRLPVRAARPARADRHVGRAGRDRGRRDVRAALERGGGARGGGVASRGSADVRR